MLLPTLCDANVLYPSLLRNLLLRLAVADLCDLRWTDEIQAEWLRNVVAKTASTEEALQRTQRLMETALPKARVSGYESLITQFVLPDPNDRHVLAAAAHAEAGHLLTFNLKDFPLSSLQGLNVEVTHPDPWFCHLYQSHPQEFSQVVLQLLYSLKKPPMHLSDLINTMQELQLPQFSLLLHEMI